MRPYALVLAFAQAPQRLGSDAAGAEGAGFSVLRGACGPARRAGSRTPTGRARSLGVAIASLRWYVGGIEGAMKMGGASVHTENRIHHTENRMLPSTDGSGTDK